jgi:hypothetical protein
VQGAGDHAFGDFEVLADIEDAGGGSALFGFRDGDFSHWVLLRNVVGCC